LLIFFFKASVVPTKLKGEVIVKSRGGFTAVATLNYTVNGRQQVLKRNINGLGGSYTFEYDRPASDVSITVGAVGYSKDIFTDIIKTTPQCYDLYGALPSPKYTAIDC
jgi:hypothetical protein